MRQHTRLDQTVSPIDTDRALNLDRFEERLSRYYSKSRDYGVRSSCYRGHLTRIKAITDSCDLTNTSAFLFSFGSKKKIKKQKKEKRRKLPSSLVLACSESMEESTKRCSQVGKYRLHRDAESLNRIVQIFLITEYLNDNDTLSIEERRSLYHRSCWPIFFARLIFVLYSLCVQR